MSCTLQIVYTCYGLKTVLPGKLVLLCSAGAITQGVGRSQLSSISGSDTESGSDDDDAPHGAHVAAASPRICFEDPGESLLHHLTLPPLITLA